MSTNISWTDEVWNPTTGCSRVSEGCRNCYAAALAPRLAAMGQKGYTALPWTAKNAPDNVFLHAERLEKPLRWRKPRRVFVNSMSDLFHELVPFEFIDRVFAVMALAPHHTYQVLTKRPERMARYFADPRPESGPSVRTRVTVAASEMDLSGRAPAAKKRQFSIREWHKIGPPYGGGVEWPLPNVWLGTSVEDQRAADERIPHLLRTPAAIRFLSCEPLLGKVYLRRVEGFGRLPVDCLTGGWSVPRNFEETHRQGPRVHWVIAGGESGPNHRPMKLEWIRSLRDQCKEAGVAFFAKQNSGPRSEMPLPEDLQQREFPGVAA